MDAMIYHAGKLSCSVGDLPGKPMEHPSCSSNILGGAVMAGLGRLDHTLHCFQEAIASA